jgi:hypothetical protein
MTRLTHGWRRRGRRLAVLAAIMAGSGSLAVVPPASADTPSATPATCTAQAHVDSRWSPDQPWGGAVLSVTVRNTSPAPITGWTAGWTLGAGQQVTSRWGATVTVADRLVTAVDLPYNATLAPGATVTFGVQLSGPVPEQPPVATCATGDSGTDRVRVPVTDADDGQTVVLRVGDLLVGSFVASDVPPTVTGDAIEPVSVTGGYPTRQPLEAVYRGAVVGSADVTTHGDADCYHAVPACVLPFLLVTVHVTVIPADSPVPRQHRVVLASLADSGSTVPLRVGDTLHVMLPDTYRQPTTAGPVLTPREPATGGYPGSQVMNAYYIATAGGTQDVQSITDYDCLHSEPACARPQQQWIVHVTVTP